MQHATLPCFAFGGLDVPCTGRTQLRSNGAPVTLQALSPGLFPFREPTMALPPAAPHRQFRHRRSINIEVHARGDGLWEVDARLTDVRARPAVLAGRVREAGEPIHEMLLRIVVDEQFNILEAGSETRWMPYPGHCDAPDAQGQDAYGRLVGLNLMKGFRHAVRQRLGGVLGCTHLSELTQVLPTAVVQAFAGDVINTREDSTGHEQPFQIDRCRALRSDGPAVQIYYPRWYRKQRSAELPPLAS